MRIKISEDYTKTPGGRYMSDGPFSGEDFRDRILEPALVKVIKEGTILVIDFDGDVYGYPVGFLEEAFGGLVRKGYSKEELSRHLVLISNDDAKVIDDIKEFISDEEKRLILKK